MQPKLPELFGLLPKAQVEVVQGGSFSRERGLGRAVHAGSAGWKTAGKVYVNTYEPTKRSLLTIESTAYHEGIPGHHMQNSIAQELPSLPPFPAARVLYGVCGRVGALLGAAGQGGGLLPGAVLGLWPVSDELLRACRLVLDTGVHSKHWTRQQMVDYFHAHSGENEPDVQAETDRYVAWPAQALAYKLGQLKITQLWERAKTQLGAKYDVRAFHDEILNGRALPLDTLDAWIAGVDRPPEMTDWKSAAQRSWAFRET